MDSSSSSASSTAGAAGSSLALDSAGERFSGLLKLCKLQKTAAQSEPRSMVELVGFQTFSICIGSLHHVTLTNVHATQRALGTSVALA
ncbi:hypothetical protein KCU74_g46, partial [Aureobasidium melanogenum]